MSSAIRNPAWSAWWLFVALVACDSANDSGGADPQPLPEPASLRLLTPVPDSSDTGLPLAVDLAVEVLDQAGSRVSHTPVNLAVGTDSGTADFVGGNTTGSDGVVDFRWTLGPATGTQRLEVAVDGVPPLTLTTTGFESPRFSVVELNGQPYDGTPLALADSINVRALSLVRAGDPVDQDWLTTVRVDPSKRSMWPQGDTVMRISEVDEMGSRLHAYRVDLPTGERDTLNLTSYMAPAGNYDLGILAYRQDDPTQTWRVTPLALIPVTVSNSDTTPPQLTLLHPADTVLDQANDSIILRAVDQGFFSYGAGYAKINVGGCRGRFGSYGGLESTQVITYVYDRGPCVSADPGDSYLIIIEATDRAFNFAEDTIRVRIRN